MLFWRSVPVKIEYYWKQKILLFQKYFFWTTLYNHWVMKKATKNMLNLMSLKQFFLNKDTHLG